MASWAIGVLLIVAGLLWVALRATIGKKARSGSWWSHLLQEMSVIEHIPIVGVVWRVLPMLLVAAGILWLAGYRPPGLDNWPPPGPACGDESHRPATVEQATWASYECRPRADAGDAWSQCLSRRAYTDDAQRGCPGKQRCCPPPAESVDASEASDASEAPTTTEAPIAPSSTTGE